MSMWLPHQLAQIPFATLLVNATYSTFSYETLRLLEDGARFYAVVYVGASLVAGFGTSASAGPWGPG